MGADIVAGPFVYQAKLRRGMPSYLRDWLRGIVGAAERAPSLGQCTGVVVWNAPNARDDDAVVGPAPEGLGGSPRAGERVSP